MNASTRRPPSGADPAPDPWPSAWVRAALEPAILGSLARGPLHGYGIAQALADRGFGRLRGGSLYPVLGRLEEAGQVTARWTHGDAGPGRKDYALTDDGRASYAAAVESWHRLGAALAALGADPQADPPATHPTPGFAGETRRDGPPGSGVSRPENVISAGQMPSRTPQEGINR